MSENDTPQRYPDPEEAYRRPVDEQPTQQVPAAPGEGTPPVQPVTGPPMGQPSGPPTSPSSGPQSAPPSVSGAPDQTAPQPPIWAAQQGPYPPQQQPHPGAWYGAPAYGVPPQQPGHPYGPPPGAQPDRRGRGGRWAAAGLLAVLLAGGGGVAGGLIAHAIDDNGTSSSSSAPHSTAPIIDRSSLASIAAGVKDSVVSIQTQDAEGSGVILTADGYILTNNHVVADATGKTVKVLFDTGKTVDATIVGTDPKTDIAVVKASGVSGLQAAKFGDSSAVQVGDTVLAIGSPLGLDSSVTAGIVSALNRTIQESGNDRQNPNPFNQQQSTGTAIAGAIQTDAAINPGNSGGALVNTAGQVIGINTAIATADNTSSGNVGIGFAIPSNKAKTVADELIKGQKVSHPYIGIGVGDADNNSGATVASVVSGAPADKAGLKQGDVITKANNTDIHNSNDLLNVVQSAKVGDNLRLTVTRGGSTQEITVTVGES